MKHGIRSLVLALSLFIALASIRAHATVTQIALWDFSTAGSFNAFPTADLQGTTTMTTSGGSISPTVTGGANGVLQYSFNSSGAGVAGLNGAAFVLTLQADSTHDLSGFSTSYTIGGTKFTSATGTWYYRIGTSGAYTFLGTDSLVSSTPGYSDTWNIPTLSAGQTLQLEFVLTNPTAANGSGSLTFDNLSVGVTGLTLVPEPMNYSLATFGLIIIGGSAGRYYIRRNRRKAEAA